jgi:polyhydroxybutyrate depolymerase
MVRRFVLLVLALLYGSPSQACNAFGPCRVGDIGEYRVSPPPGWDGRMPIGAFFFMHGHRSSASEMLDYKELSDVVHQLGFMLVAPQGLGDSWGTPGSPGEGKRDEVAFINAVIGDLEKNFPIDRKRIVASGFSQGSAVVWEIACKGDGRFAAFLPIAGVWWQPMPTACTAPPRPMLHIHGTADRVMPMGGRNLGGRFQQGDVSIAVATMRVNNACRPGSSRHEQRGELTCAFETDCASGKPVALCLHPGDHHTNPAWFMQVKDWLEAALK